MAHSFDRTGAFEYDDTTRTSRHFDTSFGPLVDVSEHIQDRFLELIARSKL